MLLKMKRPKYIEKQLAEVNDYLRQMKVQEKNMLFYWWCNYLSAHNWYRGFNFHIDREIEINGEVKIIRALTGPIRELPMYQQKRWYLQIW